MARPSVSADCVNFDREEVRERLKRFVDRLAGDYRIRIEPTRLTRSQKQNAKYFAGWVTPLAVYLMEQGSCATMAEAKEEAHREIVLANLGADVYVSPITGERRERPKPTHTLSAEEFSAFMLKAETWLADMGIAVEDWRDEPIGGRR